MSTASEANDGIAIVGMECVFPGAPDLQTFWRNICNGVDAIRDVPEGRVDSLFFEEGSNAVDRLYTRRGGFVDEYAQFDAAAYGIMPIAVNGAEPDQLLTLQVAHKALADAGYMDRPFPREKTSIIIGRGNYLGAGMVRLANQIRGAEQLVACLRSLLPDLSEEKLGEIKADFQTRAGSFAADNAIGLVPNLVASRIANRLDLGGSAYTVDAACASALLAVDQACRELRSRQADMAIAGGVHLCHDPPFWSVLCMLGAVSRQQSIRPFDKSADGMLIGEGIGLFVLKRLEDAERDQDRIYAVIRGSGVSSDGRDSSIMAPAVAGQLLALERAWDESGLDRSAVGLIEAHGTGTRSGDAAELQTLANFFGPAVNGEPRGGLGTVKSMIGHTMPAAGAAGLIKAAMAVYTGTLPPTLHCDDPQEIIEQTRFRIVTKSEPWPAEQRVAGVNAFGFGGINCHVVVQSPPASSIGQMHPGGKTEPAIDILLLAADSKEALLAGLSSRQSPSRTGKWRVAVVNPTPERIEAAKAAVEAGRARFGRDGLFFSQDGLVSRGGKIAFMFPGVEARVDPQVQRLASFFNLPAPETGDDDLGARGSNAFAVSAIYDVALRSIGVQPDVIAGHSIGEWAGMVSAGIIEAEEALSFAGGLDPAQLVVADVAYLAAGAGADHVRELISELPDVVISHDNCEHQSILCGPSDQINEALRVLRAEQILCEVLPFRSGFHSPAFAEHTHHYSALLDTLQLHPAKTPLWSATTCEPYPVNSTAISVLFVRHLTEAVRFRELTQRLWEEGVRVFIQVGAGSLTAFVDDSLMGSEHHAIATCVTQRDGLVQLYWAAAALFVEGVDVDLERLGLATAKPAFRGLPIQLGVPLIRLGVGPLQLEPRTKVANSTMGASNPLMSEFNRTLEALTEGQGEIATLLSRREGSTALAPPPLPPEPVTAAAEPPAPKTSEKLLLSCETYPELADHCLFPQPEGWPVLADRSPSVPMTMSLALMVDAAERLMPDKVGIAVENVVASAWMLVEPPLDATVTAEALAPDRVRIKIAEKIEGEVVMADAYPERPLPTLPPIEKPVTPSIREESIYRDRWMFHGPAYQGLTGLGVMGKNGIQGELTALPAKGALLDAAGQLASTWILLKTQTDRLSMPVKVGRLELFGPELRNNEKLVCNVQIKYFGQREVRSDIELLLDGRVYFRLTNWEDWRFHTGGGLFSVMRFPERNLLAETYPGGFTLIHDSDRALSAMEFLAGRFLTAVEIADVKKLDGRRRQGDWLYGRIAAKDAVRSLLFERGYAAIYPVEIVISNDDQGRPLVSGPFKEDVRVSIAHSEKVAVALAAVDVDPGIDVEKIEPRSEAFAALSFTEDELALLPEGDRDEWLTRFWCAKEAVGKARGTGLAGSPKTLHIRQLDGQRLMVEDKWVHTQRIGSHVVAYTK